VNENLLYRQLSFGQGVVVVPQAQLNPIVHVGTEGCEGGILHSKAFEEDAVFVNLYEQGVSGNKAGLIVLLQNRDEVLKSAPVDIVERVQRAFSFIGGNNYAQAGEVVQIVVHGLEGDLGLFMKFFRALCTLVHPGEKLYPSVGQKKQEGRGSVGIIEPLEAIRWRGFGQDYT